PTEGYEDAIVVPAITADNCEIKHGLLTLVQNKQFFGHDKEDPHAHIRYFNKITSTLKFPNVSNTSIKLMLFPFSLEGAAQIWLEKEPSRSIFTWDDLVSKFINKFFPPSKTTNLRNEITNFQQRFDESFSEAWDRFKDLLRACPHHSFSKLHQLDTIYNALNSKDQDSLNSIVGGNFLDKMPRECLAIAESKSKVRYSRNKPVVAKVSMNTTSPGISPDVSELKDMVKALLIDKKSQNQAPATVKAVKESCVTCGGAHSYRNCPATDGNVYRDNIQEFISQASAVNYNQGNTSYRPSMMSNQIRPPGFPPFVNSNNASTLSSCTLSSNTIANPRSDLKSITTRSGVSYDGPQIPPLTYFLLKVVENEPEATKDTMHPTNNGSTEDVQPPVVQSKLPILTSEPVNSLTIEPVNSPISALRPNLRPSIPYPSRIFADALILMPKFGPSIKSLLNNKDKLCELARTLLNEHCSMVLLKKLPKKLGDPGKFLISCDFLGKAECLALADLGASINLMPLSEVLGFSDVIESGNPTPYYDPIVSTTSPTLTSFRNNDFLFEEVDAFLAIDDDPTSPKVDQFYLNPEEDILLLEAFLNNDPSLPPSNQGNYLPEVRKELKICDAKSNKSSIDEPPKVELKDLPPHLEYAFLEGDDKFPVIIVKDLSVEEKTAVITFLKSHKRAIAWKHSDIKGIDPKFCTHKILMEEDFKPAVQHQRRVNPKIHDVIKQEVLKLLDAGLIYPISDSPWVIPVHFVPKKIPIDPKDQEKPTFTCPYGTLAYRRMPFGLCNAPGTFQRDMPFELMCDANDLAFGAVLGQRQDKHFRPIHYASKTMTEAESNYTTTKKEMLAVVYAFEKFWSYLIMNKSIVYTDHSALKYLFAKKDSKARLLRWVLLLSEFTFKVIDTKGAENLAADHLS
nr:reverse transcriptase domain-containing protein [Tanacetum cinerariifolium]